jgi:DNA-binding NarL/FixJ family response regulator
MSVLINGGGRLNRPRILLADDHQLVLERVTALLQSVFDVVGAARNGREMISQAMRLNPDVIVADISMPELSGIEAAHQLHERGSTAKLVFLTIHSNDEFVSACLAEGALGYVVKSHMKSDLIPAIHAALSGQSFISSVTQPRG